MSTKRATRSSQRIPTDDGVENQVKKTRRANNGTDDMKDDGDDEVCLNATHHAKASLLNDNNNNTHQHHHKEQHKLDHKIQTEIHSFDRKTLKHVVPRVCDLAQRTCCDGKNVECCGKKCSDIVEVERLPNRSQSKQLLVNEQRPEVYTTVCDYTNINGHNAFIRQSVSACENSVTYSNGIRTEVSKTLQSDGKTHYVTRQCRQNEQGGWDEIGRAEHCE